VPRRPGWHRPQPFVEFDALIERMIAPMFDLFHPIDALRLWCCLGTLDLLRNVGYGSEIVQLRIKTHQQLSGVPPAPRFLGRLTIWIILIGAALGLVALSVLCWPFVLASNVRNRRLTYWNRDASPSAPFAPSRLELRERLMIEQVESREGVHDPLGAAPDVPFGFLNPAWRQFVAERQPGDNLRRFESRRMERGHIVVRKGYAWVRRFGRVRRSWISALSKS
jgi:hypothetical protein